MKASATKKNGVLHFYFEGELDEHAARQIRRRIDAFIDENAAAESAVFHLTHVTFMDSTGIGFFIGRYKKLAVYSIPAYFADVGCEADKVLSLSGVYTVVPKLPPAADQYAAGQSAGQGAAGQYVAGRETDHSINGGRRA